MATTCADEVSGVVAEQTFAGVQGVAGVPRVRYARRVGFGSLESRRHGIGCGGDVGKGRVSGWETRKRAEKALMPERWGDSDAHLFASAFARAA